MMMMMIFQKRIKFFLTHLLMLSYATEGGVFGVSPKPDLPSMLQTLGKQPDYDRIERLHQKGVDRTDYILFLFNRCQPQDSQFEVSAPQTFTGARVPYFCPVEQINQDNNILILWFVLEHSDGTCLVYRYIGRLFEKQLYQLRGDFHRHARDTWFYGHQLPRDCVSLDGGSLNLFDSRQQQVIQDEGPPPIQALTRKQALHYCAGNLRAFDSPDNGFLRNEDRRDVDHYLCFVAFVTSDMSIALKLLKTRLSARQYQTFVKMYQEQIRECKDIADDANLLQRFHQTLGDQSREYYRQLRIQVDEQRRRDQETQAIQANRRFASSSSKNGNRVAIVPTRHIE